MQRFVITMFAAALVVTAPTPAFGRARMYSPNAGRFLQPDPIGYPDGMNRYAAHHVMQGGLDPSGLRKEPEHVVRSEEFTRGQMSFDTCGYPPKKGGYPYGGGVLRTTIAFTPTSPCSRLRFIQVFRITVDGEVQYLSEKMALHTADRPAGTVNGIDFPATQAGWAVDVVHDEKERKFITTSP